MNDFREQLSTVKMFAKILILAAIVGISSAVVYDFDSKTSKLDPTKSLNCLFFHAEL